MLPALVASFLSLPIYCCRMQDTGSGRGAAPLPGASDAHCAHAEATERRRDPNSRHLPAIRQSAQGGGAGLRWGGAGEKGGRECEQEQQTETQIKVVVDCFSFFPLSLFFFLINKDPALQAVLAGRGGAGLGGRRQFWAGPGAQCRWMCSLMRRASPISPSR